MRGPVVTVPKRPGALPGLALCTALVLGALTPVQAQQAPAAGAQAQAPLPVLTLDFEKLFESTRWGKRIRTDLAAASQALTTENNRIADDLVAEEKDLTERRATLAPEEFRKEADAFDQRATGIRNAQKAKAQALSTQFDADRQAFFNAAAPLLDEVLAARGAVVVLDRRAIIRGLNQADITDDLVALMDARLGEGLPSVSVPAPETANDLPETTPDAAAGGDPAGAAPGAE